MVPVCLIEPVYNLHKIHPVHKIWTGSSPHDHLYLCVATWTATSLVALIISRLLDANQIAGIGFSYLQDCLSLIISACSIRSDLVGIFGVLTYKQC